MTTLTPIATGHQDLIHDVAFDYYGKSLATCSLDRHIRVFTSERNKWVPRDTWRAHDSAVVKLAWAPPEYGQILALVSYDRTLKIWEHRTDGVALNSGSCFRRLKTLTDSQSPLFDVAFAPGHLGEFKVAAIGSDCQLRIYQAFRPQDLGDLTLVHTLMLTKKPANNLEGSYTVNWSSAKYAQEKLCASAVDVCSIYVRNSENQYVLDQLIPHDSIITDVSWAPLMGRSFELLATASKDGIVRVFKIIDKTLDNYGVLGGMGSKSSLKYDDGDQKTLPDEDQEMESTSARASTLEISLIAQLDDHKSDVWSVSWNSTGTILSSTGDDGKVRFWKANKFFRFSSMAVTSVQDMEPNTEQVTEI